MNTNIMQVDAGLEIETPREGLRIPDFGGLLTWSKDRLAAVRRLHQRRQAISELGRMSDRRLADLGIPRGQIPEVVDGLIARDGPTVGR